MPVSYTSSLLNHMQQRDKQIKTGGAADTGKQIFTFPGHPQPIVIEAKSLEEATKKFEEITQAPQPKPTTTNPNE